MGGTGGKLMTGGPTLNGSTWIVANNIFYSNNSTQLQTSLSFPGGNNALLKLTGNDYFSGGGMNLIINSTGYNSLAALQAAGFEKVSSTPVGTTANPNLAGTFPAGNCNLAPAVGWTASCPLPYQLTTSSPAGKTNGLNLNTIYGIVVGARDFYGNAITPSTLPIGAAGNM
jgi:hypothetical protein